MNRTSLPETEDTAFHHGERVIARRLALASAYRLLMGMELLALVHGESVHIFPPDGDGRQDNLTVRGHGNDVKYLFFGEGPNGMSGRLHRDIAARLLSIDIGRDVR